MYRSSRNLRNPCSLYRVYKSTVQRQALNLKSLNSHAAFLFVKDDEREVIAWIGEECDIVDIELVKEIGLAVMNKDYKKKHVQDIPVVIEGQEIVHYLQVVLDILWTNSNLYSRKSNVTERKLKLTNNSISVGLIEKVSPDSDVYDFQETSFAHPDANGAVPRVNFAPIEEKTVAYINVGDQWDIWISRGVSYDDEVAALKFLEFTLSSQLSDTVAFKRELLAQYIRIVRQGEERILFRRPLKIFTDFEPPGKTVPRMDPSASQMSIPRNTSITPDGKKGKSFELTFDEGDTGNIQSAYGSVSMSERIKPGTIPAAAASFMNPDESSYTKKTKPPRNISFMDQQQPTNVKFEDIVVKDKHKTTDATAAVTVTSLDELSAGVAPELLVVVDSANVTPEQRIEVISAAASEPNSLLGWQVEIDEGIYSGVFIVTKTKKSLMFKTMFYLVASDGDEFWVKLQRGPSKHGVRFRPLRKVVLNAAATTSKEVRKTAADVAADADAAAAAAAANTEDDTQPSNENKNNSDYDGANSEHSSELGSEFATEYYDSKKRQDTDDNSFSANSISNTIVSRGAASVGTTNVDANVDASVDAGADPCIDAAKIDTENAENTTVVNPSEVEVSVEATRESEPVSTGDA